LSKTLTLLKSTVALAAVAVLGGCMTLGREFKEPVPVTKFPTQTSPKTMERMPSEEPEGPADSAISVDETAFMVRPMKPQEVNLPDFYVHNMSATESGVQDSLQLMLEGSGLTLNVEGGPRAMERFGATSIQNVHGGLRAVLDTLSEQIGFFWSASKGTLTIEPDRMFVVELPPVLAEDSLASMANTMQFLGARDTYLDRMSRTLVFRANRKSLGVIDQYLDGVRATRSMLVYEIKVYQVDLSDDNTQGISWNALNGSTLQRPKLVADGVTDAGKVVSDLAKTFALTSSGAGLGAVLMGPKFSVDALVQFLKTQGSVKTVSQPRLAMLNGAKGMLRVGETTTYVSKVGSNLASGISQVTVETKDLRTGLELGITGEEHDSTIYTRVSLSLSELVRFNKYTTLGTDLNLPDVTDRELNTAIRMPAGYTALLGGITVTRETDDRAKGIQNNTKQQSVQRSEIVMLVKPTIVRFKKRVPDAPVAVVAAAAPSTTTIPAVLTPKPEVPVVLGAAPVAAKPAAAAASEAK
jgi:MSHA biogenesis protein MshL